MPRPPTTRAPNPPSLYTAEDFRVVITWVENALKAKRAISQLSAEHDWKRMVRPMLEAQIEGVSSDEPKETQRKLRLWCEQYLEGADRRRLREVVKQRRYQRHHGVRKISLSTAAYDVLDRLREQGGFDSFDALLAELGRMDLGLSSGRNTRSSGSQC